MEIYAFSGKSGVGKNYIAEHIFAPRLPPKPTLIMAFADQIKVDLCVKQDIAYDRLFDEKDQASRNLLKTTAQKIQSQYGTEIWLKTLATWLKIYQARGIQRVIITDLRFEHEYQWIKKHGGTTIRIEAPNRHLIRLNKERQSGLDSSETGLDANKFDFTIYNDFHDQATVIDQINLITK